MTTPPSPLALVRLRLRYHPHGHLPPQNTDLIAAWRSAFGKALRRAVCMMSLTTACGDCVAHTHCLFPLMFEDVAQGVDPRYQAPPRPFVPQLIDHREHPRELCLALTLLGNTIHQAAPLIPVFRTVGEQGLALGRRRLRLSLSGVDWETPVLSGHWQVLTPATDTAAAMLPPLPPVPRTLRLRFLTPVRLKQDGCPVGPSRFSVGLLLERLQARLALLRAVYGDGETTPPDSDMTAPFHRVRCDLHWQDHPHHGKRTEVVLGGLLGSVELTGSALEAVWPDLWLGQVLGVGNHTALGFGQYRVETTLD